jgi:hypothetical protein
MYAGRENFRYAFFYKQSVNPDVFSIGDVNVNLTLITYVFFYTLFADISYGATSIGIYCGLVYRISYIKSLTQYI